MKPKVPVDSGLFDTDSACGRGRCIDNKGRMRRVALTLHQEYDFVDIDETQKSVTVIDDNGRRTPMRLDRFEVLE